MHLDYFGLYDDSLHFWRQFGCFLALKQYFHQSDSTIVVRLDDDYSLLIIFKPSFGSPPGTISTQAVASAVGVWEGQFSEVAPSALDIHYQKGLSQMDVGLGPCSKAR